MSVVPADLPDPDAPFRPGLGHRVFDEFFRSEYASVVRLGVALTGDQHIAEDLAQEAFASARQRWDRIGRLEQPAAWVRRCVANRSVSRYRRLVTEAKVLARLHSPAPVELPEPHEEVWEAIRQLPRRQAQVITLAVLEDRTVADVASLLGCGEETVRTHLRRARRRLAEALGEDVEVDG